ncbi:MAG: response regulator transcription factor, partial [Deltaproteobacteria bacterium]|nr:response regulator transcription factor [Deltaproteobacteria bacterium]
APDVIIMDISMPDINGIEATSQLLVESPGVKVIALSMHSDSLFVLNMLRSGALGYLLKDCALEELVKAIRTVMRQQTYISPGVSDLLIQDLACRCTADSSSAYSVLTTREREVLQLLAAGQGTVQIAASLGLSSKTIEAHRKQIMNKLNLNSVAELTKYAIRQGLASLDE